MDDLQRGGLKIIQSEVNFAFSIDAVLLSHFAAVKSQDRIIDLGTGSGVIPLLLTTRAASLSITGLELSAESADMAERSVALNNLTDIIKICRGDIRHVRELFPVGKADMVTANPPYLVVGTGDLSPKDARKIARHEVSCTLDDVITAANWLLRTGGKFALVHRPDRLSEIMRLLSAAKLEAKRLRLVHPMPGREANLLLLEALKNAKPGLRVEPPIYVHKQDGSYTDEIMSLYAGGVLK